MTPRDLPRDGRSRRGEVPGRGLTAGRGLIPTLVVLSASLATIALAWPRLISGVAEAPFQQIVLASPSAVPSSEGVVRRTIAAKEKAVSVSGSGRTWADIGMLRLREATQAGLASPEGRVALDASIDAHRRALALEPSQAFVLTRLAQGVLMRDGPGDPLVPVILAAAIEAAPYDSNLVVARVNIALAAWDFLQPGLQAAVQEQIHIAADQAPTGLAEAAARWFAFQRILVTLGDDPRLLKRFAYAYIRL